MKKSEIITAIIAIYCAFVSTIVIVRHWRTDRARMKFTVRRNMQILGDLK